MRIIVPATVSLLCALSGMAQGLRTAGTLLVDISAEALTGNDGDAVAQWPNSGSLGGNFSALTGNTGATFTNSLLGKKAVLFSGTTQSVLTNCVAPSSLTGGNPWTVEAWIWAPSLRPSSSVYLSWTQDRGGGSYEDKVRMMLRYDSSTIAVDHKGCSVSFGYGVPVAGAWHHIVAAHSALGPEHLYVDGNLSGAAAEDLKLESGKPLALGGVLQLNTAAYTNVFSGAVSRIRIHTGTLSEQDARHNYLEEAWAYNAANSTAWTGGAGNWNDTANWTNGTVGGPGKAVRVVSGAIAVTNNVTASALSALDIMAGSIGLSASASRLDTRSPFFLGRGAANAAALNLDRGSMTVSSGTGPAFLDMGMEGAAGTLTVGGTESASTLSASRIRIFAGSGNSDIQVKSNAVLELDGVLAEAVTNVSMGAAGGTLRNKAGSTMGYLHNVPQVKIGAGGLIFDAVTNSAMAVSSVLTHDPAAPAQDGGIRKISPGTLILSGANTYAGETSVEAGSLVLAPRLLDGLVYRLDASSNALSTLTFDGTGSNVVSWADANGSGILFTSNKTEKCPAYDASLFGGRGGLRFSRDPTICRLAADRSSRVQSVFAVFSAAGGNSIGGFWGQSGGDYGIRFNSTSVQYAGNGNDFASSGWMYVNGADGTSFTQGQPAVLTAIAGAAQTWLTAIGDYWASTNYRRVYKGDIAEVLAYDRRLDDLERKAVEQHLMAKWLGTVPAPDFSAPLLPSNSVLNIRSGASVELGGSSVRLAALNGSGSIGNRSVFPAALTFGAGGLYAGAITGNVSIVKTGSGRATLSGPNTFTGTATIEAGTLMLASGVTAITGLVYRLDASQTNTLTTLADGSNVTAWADAGGSGYTFATTNDIHCPVYDRALFNGRGGLRFGLGSRKRMCGSAVTNAQTVFAVNMIRDTLNDNGGFWGTDAADKGLRIGGTTWYFPGNGDDFHYVGAGGLVGVNGVASNANVTVGQPHLVTSVSGSPQSFKPAIGDYWCSPSWPGRYYRGEVAEILVYERRLTDLERQIVEASLMAKWFPTTGGGAVVPQTATVSVAAGAALDLAGGAVTIASLSGGGSVSNGLLTVTGDVAPDGNLNLPAAPALTGRLTLDVAANGACDSISVAGAIDVSGLALLLNLPQSVPSVASYTLVSAPGGVAGKFASAAVAGPWNLIYEPAAVRLVYCAGTLLMLH